MKTVLLLTALTMLAALAPDSSSGIEFKEILDKTVEREFQNDSAVRDAVYTADGLYTELNDEGKRVKEVRTKRTVYRKGSDKSYSEYSYIYVDGKKLTGEEMKKETAKMRGGDKDKNKDKKSLMSPFNPAAIGNYNFSYAGSADWNGQPSWMIDFRPKVPDETLGKGRAWISRSDYNIFCLEFGISKMPWMLKNFNMKIVYADYGGYWLPGELEMKMRVKIKLLLTFADKHLTFKDIYTGYKPNGGIRDSFFKDKVLD